MRTRPTNNCRGEGSGALGIERSLTPFSRAPISQAPFSQTHVGQVSFGQVKFGRHPAFRYPRLGVVGGDGTEYASINLVKLNSLGDFGGPP